MLYSLLSSLQTQINALNVVRYITFRSMLALLSALTISLFFSPWFIKILKKAQIGQQVRNDGPKSHFSKAGTPTMGGGMILLSTLIPALLWMDPYQPVLWYMTIVCLGFGLIGFYDDYLKVTKKNTKGLSGKKRLILESLIALSVLIFHQMTIGFVPEVVIPFTKGLSIPLGYLYIPFAAFVIVGSANAVNITDGLDGLAIGPVMISAATFAILSYVAGHLGISDYLLVPYVPGAGELAIFSAALVGAGLGFLWYNTYPAQVFMGDIGSLPLGAALGTIAVYSRQELLLGLCGGVFVMETLSVIAQVLSFKWRGKRVFKMAPIHHHFELKGWPEPKVIVRFWIISIVLSIFSLMSLKLR